MAVESFVVVCTMMVSDETNQLDRILDKVKEILEMLVSPFRSVNLA